MSKMPPAISTANPFADFMQSWFGMGQMQRLFNTLYEPILPNGTFAGIVINENNSADPAVERHVVSQFSYGRQLDALIDAVDVLIEELPVAPRKQGDAAKLKSLQDMKGRIDTLKSQVRKSQVERIVEELGRLADSDLEQCAQAVSRLKSNRRKRLEA